MTDYKVPRTEIERGRCAITNVVEIPGHQPRSAKSFVRFRLRLCSVAIPAT